MSPSDPSPAGPAPSARPDLREQRRIRARVAVQDAALELFARQGYDGTTVEEIAAAAGISPATFYRYFPKKEDVILYDHVDFAFTAAILDAPAELDLVGAFRHAARTTWDEALPPAARARESQRLALAFTVPEIRARLLESTVGTLDLMAATIAERTGLPPADPRLLTWAGMIFGAVLAQIVRSVDDIAAGHTDMGDILTTMEAALDTLSATLTDADGPFRRGLAG